MLLVNMIVRQKHITLVNDIFNYKKCVYLITIRIKYHLSSHYFQL